MLESINPPAYVLDYFSTFFPEGLTLTRESLLEATRDQGKLITVVWAADSFLTEDDQSRFKQTWMDAGRKYRQANIDANQETFESGIPDAWKTHIETIANALADILELP